MMKILMIILATLAASALFGAHASDTETGDQPDLADARAATAPFSDTTAAADAGYGAFPEGVPLHECIAALDGHGAMGLHWVNETLLDTTLDPSKPEVLVFEPTENGELQLVALEYVVFAEAWAEEHGDAAPHLFGMDMVFVEEPNRYELPAFWQRHAWIWKDNSAGTFADHNPAVTCDFAD